jgi:hypothetical protein
MIVYVLTTCWNYVIVTNFPLSSSQKTLDNLWFYVHSNHKCDMHMKTSCVFWFRCVAFVVTTVVCFFFFLNVSTLWFVISQFVQYLSIFLVLLCIFVGVAYLVLCGTDSPFSFAIIIHFSHNITASLCCCSVEYFILIVTRYDCKPTLNTVIRKLLVVGTCKPWTNF